MLRLLYHPHPPTNPNPPCVSMHTYACRVFGCALLLSWRGGRARQQRRRRDTAHTTRHHTMQETVSLSLWVRLPDLHRVRPHYVDSTASRPICEVKLRQAGLVVWFVRTCEVLVLYFTLKLFASVYFRVGLYAGFDSQARTKSSETSQHFSFAFY